MVQLDVVANDPLVHLAVEIRLVALGILEELGLRLGVDAKFGEVGEDAVAHLLDGLEAEHPRVALELLEQRRERIREVRENTHQLGEARAPRSRSCEMP